MAARVLRRLEEVPKLTAGHSMLRAVCMALDALDVAMCVFDAEDTTLLWNQRFVEFFPEHDGHVQQGEPYAENLRRFYRCRLSAEEMPHLERYVTEGVARHRAQVQPFDFDHHGYRLRASSVQAGRLGRVRFWRKTTALPVGTSPALGQVAPTMSSDVREALDCIADGVLIVDDGGSTIWANANFCRMYGIRPSDDIRGLDFPTIYRNAWRADAPTHAFRQAYDTLRERRRFSGAPYEIPLPGDQWTRVVERPGATADGRGYCSHVDITALKRHQHELTGTQKRLKTLASTDGLTGLRNRTFFDASLASEWRRGSRSEGALSLLMIDIDHFKELNDEYGHLSGDDVLKAVAEKIAAHARRAGDVVSRFGGEEFVMLLPNTDGPTAVALAETLRAAVASMGITSHKGKRLAVTVSVGVSTAEGALSHQRPEILVEHADLALYDAKRTGRNRVASRPGSMALTIRPEARPTALKMLAPGATGAQRERGEAAARAVLELAGISAEDAKMGADARTAWGDSGMARLLEPTLEEVAAADAWDRAVEAALMACYRGVRVPLEAHLDVDAGDA